MKLTVEQGQKIVELIVAELPMQISELSQKMLITKLRALDLGTPEPEGAVCACDFQRDMCELHRDAEPSAPAAAPKPDYLCICGEATLLPCPVHPKPAPQRCTCIPFTNPSTFKIDPRCPEHGHFAAEQPGNDPKKEVMPNESTSNRMPVSDVPIPSSDLARGPSERAEGNEKAVFNIRCHKHANIALLCRKCIEEGIVDVDKAFGEGPAAPMEELPRPDVLKSLRQWEEDTGGEASPTEADAYIDGFNAGYALGRAAGREGNL